MKIVMKFGGTSVGDGKKIRHVAQLLKRYREEGNQIVVVTSALGGVTDELLENALFASTKGKVSLVKEFKTEITNKHHKAVKDAIDDPTVAKEVIQTLDLRIDELEKALVGICYLGELTSRSIDYICSYGERLAAPIVSGAIRSLGIESTEFTGGEAGIITSSDYGNARPLEKTYELVNKRLGCRLETQILVVTGFIGENEEGIITTLGRSGSDFTASILGAALKADEIWLWKEVNGIMTTDPRIVPEAKTIPQISYAEAMELSYFGANILHPRTIEPAMREHIPVRVKNTFEPKLPGTLVVAEKFQCKNVVKAVSLIKNVALINISGAEMVGAIGTVARLFAVLAKSGVNVIMISQGSSESNISFVISEAHVKTALKALHEEFNRGIVKEITSDKNVCVVAVVGAGMAGTPGVAKRVFGALGNSLINIIMISQGSSQYNISFVVRENDAFAAVKTLHDEFELYNGNGIEKQL
ncbi:Aspartokinase [Methanosarcina barkeri str. Wiesmoor]|uniref:Aspartokinase n=2 Tax=Methanosarcina barkeri TaxID=2208 RepID=A0A0E3LKE7_METBA|nr:aspartate kinase [Methanosarcina barkeri]AKB49391.1 Aspartokinase [Methanosarcina barkeri str. Wiesmoor]